jgi:hypothetical protein
MNAVIIIVTLTFSVLYYLTELESESFLRDVDRAMRAMRDSN